MFQSTLIDAIVCGLVGGFGLDGIDAWPYIPQPAVTQPAVTAAPAAPLPVDPGIAEGKFMVLLKDGMRVSGMPVEVTALPIDAPFGKTDVPLNLIANVQLVGGPRQAKITFRNGDTLTAQLRLDKFTIKTAYGDVTASLADMARLAAGSRFPLEEGAAAGTTASAASTSVSPADVHVHSALFGGDGSGPIFGAPAFDGKRDE